MSGLPQGWTWTTLGDLSTEVRNGISAKPSEASGRAILRISAVRPMRLDTADLRYLPADFFGATPFELEPDDLLFTRYNGNRDLVGACAQVCASAAGLLYPDKLIRVRLNPLAALPGYVEKAANASGARDFLAGKLKTSAGQVGVSGADLKAMPLPLAPLAEQQRIADKLDAILARVDACRRHLDRVDTLLKRFRQAVVDAACDGRLTETWRSRRGESRPWRVAKLSELVAELRNGLAAKPDESATGSRILRISAVRPLHLNTEDYRRLTTTASEQSLNAIRKGDVLFTRYNGSIDLVGVCAVAERDLNGYVYPDKLIRVRPRVGLVLPEFLALACSTSDARRSIVACVKSSAGQKGISGTDLRALNLMVPTLTEQHEIVAQATRLMAAAGHLERRLRSAQGALTATSPALLAKAFRGELVPQDPNDEPAAQMLARLATSTPPKKTAKRGRSTP